MSKTVYLKFTKNTANYVAGDVVAFDEDGVEMIDALIKKHFIKERNRYTKVDKPAEKVRANATVVTDNAAINTTELSKDGELDADNKNVTTTSVRSDNTVVKK